ncbi:hypothetical protein Bca4012_061496 [Brassica carinata]
MEPQVGKQAHLDHKFLMRIIIMNLPPPTGYWPFPFPADNHRTLFPAKIDVERTNKDKRKIILEKSQNIIDKISLERSVTALHVQACMYGNRITSITENSVVDVARSRSSVVLDHQDILRDCT